MQSPEILKRGLDQSSLLNSLRRRWPLALGIGILMAAVTSAVLWHVFPVQGEATALLQVHSERPIILKNIEGTGEDALNYDLYKNTQLGVFKSDFVLQRATQLAGPKYDIMTIDALSKAADPIEWLQDNLSANFMRDSEILKVTLSENLEKDELERIVNAVVAAYLEEVVFKARNNSIKTKGLLERSYKITDGKLREQRKQYFDLAKSLGKNESDGASMESTLLLDEIRLNRSRREHLQQKIADAFTEFHTVRGIERNPGIRDMMVSEKMAEDPMIQMRQQQLMMLDTEISMYESSTSHETPALKRKKMQRQKMQTELAQIERQMKAQAAAAAQNQPNLNIQQAKNAYQVIVGVYGQKIKTMDERYTELKEELKKLTEKSTDLAAKKVDLEQREELATSMATRLQEWQVEVEAQDDLERVQVLQDARVKEKINTIQRYLIVGSGGLLMLGLTCFGVGYMEFCNRRLDGPSQMDEGLGIRVVGTLPALSHRRLGKESDPVVATLMESIDSVRTTLMHDAASKDRRVVLVTSPGSQEGRTTVASQLAASLARAGRRTLLIDGDVRSPALQGLFDLPLEDGLCEVLRKQVEVSDAIRPTHAEGLWVMTAGYCDADAMHALANDVLAPVFKELRDKYDFIIVDGAPVLGLSDSLILGQYCDGAVLSVLRDYSQVLKVYQATELLKGVGIRLIGAVVNGVRTKADVRIKRLHFAAPPRPQRQEEPEPTEV